MNLLKKMALAFAVMLCTQGFTLGQVQPPSDYTEDSDQEFDDDLTEEEAAELDQMDAEDADGADQREE